MPKAVITECGTDSFNLDFPHLAASWTEAWRAETCATLPAAPFDSKDSGFIWCWRWGTGSASCWSLSAMAEEHVVTDVFVRFYNHVQDAGCFDCGACTTPKTGAWVGRSSKFSPQWQRAPCQTSAVWMCGELLYCDNIQYNFIVCGCLWWCIHIVHFLSNIVSVVASESVKDLKKFYWLVVWGISTKDMKKCIFQRWLLPVTLLAWLRCPLLTSSLLALFAGFCWKLKKKTSFPISICSTSNLKMLRCLRQLAQQALAKLRGPRLRAFLQDLGAVARGEHTVDMLQTYAEWGEKESESVLVMSVRMIKWFKMRKYMGFQNRLDDWASPRPGCDWCPEWQLQVTGSWGVLLFSASHHIIVAVEATLICQYWQCQQNCGLVGPRSRNIKIV